METCETQDCEMAGLMARICGERSAVAAVGCAGGGGNRLPLKKQELWSRQEKTWGFLFSSDWLYRLFY